MRIILSILAAFVVATLLGVFVLPLIVPDCALPYTAFATGVLIGVLFTQFGIEWHRLAKL